jgi:hypothetical protein
VTGLTAHRLVLMINVISSASALRLATAAMRLRPLVVEVAARLGVDTRGRRVAVTMLVWEGITAAAWGQLLIEPEDFDDCATIMADRLDGAFAEFTAIAAAEAGSALPPTV